MPSARVQNRFNDILRKAPNPSPASGGGSAGGGSSTGGGSSNTPPAAPVGQFFGAPVTQFPQYSMQGMFPQIPAAGQWSTPQMPQQPMGMIGGGFEDMRQQLLSRWLANNGKF